MQENEITKVEFYDDRFYKIAKGENTTYYPSVTTKLGVIAKPYLAKWRGDIGNREADLRMFESQERGIRIHSAWETICTGGTVIYNPPRSPKFSDDELKALMDEAQGHLEVIRYQDEMLAVWKLKKFLEAFGPNYEILKSEFTVFSDKYKEAGTPDTLLKIEKGSYFINGKNPVKIETGIYIADLKTGKVVDDDAFMQTAAYANCCTEMGLGPISGSMILHTGAATKSGIEGFACHVRTKDEMIQDFKDFRNVSAVWERKNKDLQPKVFDFPSIIKL